MALKAAGKPVEATADFERLLHHRPDFIEGYLQLADDPVINYHMGMVLNKTGDIKMATEKLQIATQTTNPFYGREHAEAMLRELKARS